MTLRRLFLILPAWLLLASLCLATLQGDVGQAAQPSLSSDLASDRSSEQSTGAPRDTVILKRGKAAEQVEGAASYRVNAASEELTSVEAQLAFARGEFFSEYEPMQSSVSEERNLWIALPIAAAPSNQGDIRRSVGLGGLFYVLPDVFIVRGDTAPVQILGGEATQSGEVLPRKLTYIHSSSFSLSPGENATILVNLATIDRPSIGLFREGELGRNQIIGTMLKAAVFLSFMGVGTCLVILGVLARRKMTALVAIGLVLAALQADASLFVTILNPDFDSARAAWRMCIALISLCNAYIVLFAFKDLFSGIRQSALRSVMLPVMWLAPAAIIGFLFAFQHDAQLLAIYYGLILALVVVIALRLEIAKRLRVIVVGIIGLCALLLIAVEPDFVGTIAPELFVGFVRDAVRLIIAGTLLVVVIVDIRRSLAERDRLTAERMSALETSAQTSKRLLETERQYVRARETAVQRKQQLAAASHDIRQPLVGLRGALESEAGNLTPKLQARLGDAIDYLESLTSEYIDGSSDSPGSGSGEGQGDREEQPYSLDLVMKAVEEMFSAEAEGAGITLIVESVDCKTLVPALALIRSTSNLIANALRHSGGDRLSVSALHDEERCIIEVADNGRGMSADVLAALQKRGVRGEGSQGHGLGLSIIHELSVRHNFDFEINSAPGEGTTARLRLPPV